MTSFVYDKTDKGREEIATRKHHIPARLRTLLLLVDGRRAHDDLLGSVAGLGLDAQHIDALLDQQFIVALAGSTAASPAAAPAAAAGAGASNPASARARALARQAARLAAAPGSADGADQHDEADEEAAAGGQQLANAAAAAPATGDAAEQFRQVYAFYNRSIKAAIGLRGVMLQLKVEKAVGIDDMRALRSTFLQAVIKAKGADAAIAMRDELDALLGGAPTDDDVVMPAPGESNYGALDFFNLSSGAVEY